MTATLAALLHPGDPATFADAACVGADATLFDGPTARPPTALWRREVERAEAVAHRYCHGCPALQACADRADDDRDHGVIRGGSLRRIDHARGLYLADPLIPGAPPTRHQPKDTAS